MDLSYEETMRRLEEYERSNPEKRRYCREKTFPWEVRLYKGEKQVIAVPMITAMENFSAHMAWHRCLSDLDNPQSVGETVLEAIEHIRISPVDARTEKEHKEDLFFKKATKCRNYREFNRKYLLCAVVYHEDGSFAVSPMHRVVRNMGYGREPADKTVRISAADASAETIGNAVIKCFEYMVTLPENAPEPPKPKPVY